MKQNSQILPLLDFVVRVPQFRLGQHSQCVCASE